MHLIITHRKQNFLETNFSNLTLSTNQEGQTDPQFLQTRTTIENLKREEFFTHPIDTTLRVDQDLNANPPELPGILQMRYWKNKKGIITIKRSSWTSTCKISHTSIYHFRCNWRRRIQRRMCNC